MRKRTVEVPQTHDIDKIVSSRCVETQEELERPKEMSSWQYRSRYQLRRLTRRLQKRTQNSTSTESWMYQWTNSLVMLKTPDHVAQNDTVT